MRTIGCCKHHCSPIMLCMCVWSHLRNLADFNLLSVHPATGGSLVLVPAAEPVVIGGRPAAPDTFNRDATALGCFSLAARRTTHLDLHRTTQQTFVSTLESAPAGADFALSCSKQLPPCCPVCLISDLRVLRRCHCWQRPCWLSWWWRQRRAW